jgi:hypothetical protein
LQKCLLFDDENNGLKGLPFSAILILPPAGQNLFEKRFQHLQKLFIRGCYEAIFVILCVSLCTFVAKIRIPGGFIHPVVFFIYLWYVLILRFGQTVIGKAILIGSAVHKGGIVIPQGRKPARVTITSSI